MHTQHRAGNGAHRCSTGAADDVLERERERGEHHADAGRDAARQHDGRWRTRQDAAQQQEKEVTGEGGDERHVDDVEAERAQPTVGEQQRLHREHDRDAQRTHPRSDEHRREDTPEQVATGAGGDGKIEHLDREDERRDHSGQRHLFLVEQIGSAPHTDPECAYGNDTRAHRGAAVDESIGDVHAPLASLVLSLPIRNLTVLGCSCERFASRLARPSMHRRPEVDGEASSEMS